MMSFRQFVEANQFKVFCDLDGVLSNFIEGINTLAGKKVKQDDIEDVLRSLEKNEIDFWANLPWMKEGKQFWSTIKKYDPDILSACPESTDMKLCSKGKLQWIKKNLKINESKIHIVKRRTKKDFANPNAILIDDRPKNIREWKSAGGVGIFFKNNKDAIKKLESIIQ